MGTWWGDWRMEDTRMVVRERNMVTSSPILPGTTYRNVLQSFYLLKTTSGLMRKEFSEARTQRLLGTK